MKKLVVCVLFLGLVACEKEAPVAPVSTTEIVGVLELPMSHRSAPQSPPGAGLIEVSPTEMRYEHQPILTLTQGRPAASELQGETIGKLRDALTTGTRHLSVVLRLHVLTPFVTMKQILATITAARIDTVVFAVRPVSSPTSVGWLDISSYTLMPPGENPVAIPGAAVIPWDEFVRAWGSVTDACRHDQRAECSSPSANPATGGNTNILIRTRGDGIKVEFTQFGAPEVAAAAPARVEMIEGVAGTAAPEEEDLEEPVADAHYTFRVSAVTAQPSPFSGMFAPICGSRSCGITVLADPETNAMNAISAIGASFPNGAQSPYVIFRTTR
ncbi:MAG: hypothetical protein IPK60_08280 [Sandaracinaceae bacterium]|nr:hypothetical protein [Sandaracinaceae bacterium]